MSAPKITLTREILPWFETAVLSDRSPSRYTVELKLAKEYRDRLGNEPHDVRLGYHFIKGDVVISQGEVPCRLRADEPLAHVTLPNMERVAAAEIELYLAH